MILARRKGQDWYIAGINGLEEPKSWTLDLSFLGNDYQLLIIKDGKDDKELVAEKHSVSENLTMTPLPFGGFLVKATLRNEK